MKKTLLIFSGLVLSFSLFSQTTNQSVVTVDNEATHMCGQHAALSEMQINDPQRYQEYTLLRQNQLETEASYQRSGVVYKIPVVFHIIHNNGNENISEAQVNDAVAILNRDFRKLNTDVNNVVAQFQAIAGDAEIEFVLATVAPNGACFNGITRTVTSNTTTSGQNQVNLVVAGNNVYQGVWAHNKYLNVYVAANLISGAAGYTFLPNGNSAATATNMYYNGIFMLHNYVGSIGTSNATRSRALTHEVGHWLNLSHVWGDDDIGTCGTDYVADTPTTNGSNGVCTLTKASCDGTADNVENYMDYSYCSKMFTQGQITRMRNAITSTTGGRSNIWTNNNLQSVGAITGSSICSAEINATSTALCAGTSTTFSVQNTTAQITSYSWTFPGGTPATSTAASPTVTYNNGGSYSATVVVTTSSNSRTITKTNYINVEASQTAIALPITEGFTATAFPPANWSLTNGGQAATWQRHGTVGTAPTAGNSAVMNNFNTNDVGATDDLNSPTFDLLNFQSAQLTFDVAYRPYTGQSDKLEVLVSPGCGMEYVTVYTKAGTTLATQTGNTTGYTNPTTWRNETVNLSQFVGSDYVRVKFRNTNGYGNYLYIDNVNITGVTGTPAGTASFSSSQSTACVGQTVTFTNTSNGAASYTWNFDAGASPSAATGAGPHTVTYSANGSKNVTLSINGGSSTSEQTIQVNALPYAPAFNIVNSCGSSVISATGSNIAWSNGSTGSSITVNSSAPITFTQTVNGCTSIAATAFPAPLPNPNVSMSQIAALCNYSQAITLNQGQPSGGTYSGQGVTNGMFNPSAVGNGNYQITYSYTAPNGCTQTATSQVNVSGCLGVEDANEMVFNVFPNPSTGMVKIVSSQAIQLIVVLDVMGRVVEQHEANNELEVQLDLTRLAAGTYHVQSKMNDMIKITQLVIE